MARVLVSAAVAAIAALACATAAAAPRITFVRQDGGSTTSDTYTRVYTIKADGSSPFEVTDDPPPVSVAYTAWRPDHKLILFATPGLQTVRPDGTHRHALSHFQPPSADSPTYRPDGKLIAFTENNAKENTKYAIATVHRDGSHLKQLTKFSQNDTDPTFSPSGKSIAFVRGGQIWRMHADGTHMKKVTNGSCEALAPDWSPGGKRIAYGCNGRILSISYTGTGRRTVVRRLDIGGASAGNPAWAPDGKRIAFDADGSLYTVKPDGHHLNQITTQTGNRFDSRPDW